MEYMQEIYNPRLVALSYVIAAIASYTALDLAGRVRKSSGTAGTAWLAGGAFAMGTGIWSMHFIGMLAFQLPIRVGYDLVLTGLSMVAAILASGLALKIVNTGSLTLKRLGSGGLAMGIGICTMHYVGMAAMKMEPGISYNPWLFSLSVLIAVTASIAALWLAFQLNPANGESHTSFTQRVPAALVMGIAIVGMHYTGMAAAGFASDSQGLTAGAMSNVQLGGTIALLAIAIMFTALALSVIDAHHASKNALMARSLQVANEELHSLTLHDQLTGLPNRLLLEDRFKQVLSRARRTHQEFGVMFIDLDRYKNVNDSLGHHIGDIVLKQVATRLKESLREMDTVARLGGDEFMAVLGEGSHREVAEQIAKRIVEVLSAAFQIEGHSIRISASVGLSIYPHDGTTIRDLMVHADAAMYQVKHNGRNAYRLFEPGMRSAAEKRQTLERKLNLALETNQFTLAYQPKLNILSGEITGMEALIRWHDPELGNVPPDEFIPIAESSGLILAIGEWVLRTACRQTRQWHDQGMPGLQVAVNLSAFQLNQNNLIEVINDALTSAGLEHRYLELELTESAVMLNPERARLILLELHELGIQISIDDFGTGYSSLSQLKRFPIDRIKIDRSFISEVTSSAQDATIVKAVIALAHNLDLEVIAEGVETEEQLQFIRDLAAQHYQGFLCSKALAPSEFKQFVMALKKPTLTL